MPHRHAQAVRREDPRLDSTDVQSPFGGTAWNWNVPVSAWYATHAFEHWAFTQDRVYLEKTAYPLLKEICQFWEDRLKTLPDGSLAVPDGWSPEHGPHEDGVMYDQQIVWELFQDYLDAAGALGVDEGYRKKVAGLQSRLGPTRSAGGGSEREWQADRDDPQDQHRHTSHLFAGTGPPDHPAPDAGAGQGGRGLAGRARRGRRQPPKLDLAVALLDMGPAWPARERVPHGGAGG